MFRLIVVLSLVCWYLVNNASALLSTCPTTSASSPLIRLNITLSASGMPNYPGIMFLSANGNFIFFLSVSDVGSPVSAVQGTWSCSSNTFSLTGNTYYFLTMSMSTVTGFDCNYTCGSSSAAPQTCTATYKVLSTNTIETAINYKLTSIYCGHGGWSMDEIANLSSWIGKHPTVIVLFTDWCNRSIENLFNIQLNNIWNNKSIPLITWQLYQCSYISQPGIIKLVNNNTFDEYLNQFSDRLKVWLAGNDSIYGNNDDRRAYLRLAHEMNGNWYPWSLNSTPDDYILAWRHIHNIFSSKSLDSTRLQWIWSVNYADFGNYTAENYWVGENYVDWLGIDGYNFGESRGGSWVWPNQIFDNMIGRLTNFSSIKPLSINEYGTTSIHAANTSDIQLKTEWLNRFCDYIENSQIKMASYFNIDRETDWAIFGGIHGDTIWNHLDVYSAYRNCLQSDQWIQPNNTNQRIITDEQFAGKL